MEKTVGRVNKGTAVPANMGTPDFPPNIGHNLPQFTSNIFCFSDTEPLFSSVGFGEERYVWLESDTGSCLFAVSAK